MAWAYVENGVVVDRVRVEPSTVFNQGYAALFIVAPDEVDHGWTYDGSKFIAPPQPSQQEINEQKAIEVRVDRDARLAATDWVVIKNLELNQNIPGVWEVYRQALRDIPQQPGFPNNITWPTKPE